MAGRSALTAGCETAWSAYLGNLKRIQNDPSSTWLLVTLNHQAHRYDQNQPSYSKLGLLKVLLTAKYSRWQGILRREFLNNPGDLVVFFIDERELSRLSPDSNDAVGSLREAVLEYVSLSAGARMFTEVEQLLNRWNRGPKNEAPPVLPLLAISVYAASRMQNKGEKRSTNFYYPFAKTLAGPTFKNPEALATILSGNPAEVLQESWEALDKWIRDQEGRVGVSSLRKHLKLKRIGYPISQAVIRRSDRIALTKFFDDIDFKGGQPPTEDRIHKMLQLWSNDSKGLSRQLKATMEDPQLSPVVAGIVLDLAKAWDGTVLSPAGSMRAELSIALDLEEHQLWGVLEGHDLPHEFSLESRSTEVFFTKVFKDPVLHFGEFSEPVNLQTIMAGLKFGGSDVSVELKASAAIFFREDPFVGTWLSTNELLDSEAYVIACKPEYAHNVKFLVDTYGSGQASFRLTLGKAPILGGVSIIEGIEFDSEETIKKFIRALPFKNVFPRPHRALFQPRFSGGLKIASRLSRSFYLKGGEPDLVYPPSEDGRPVEVILDGVCQTFSGRGGTIPLRRIGLEAGSHLVEINGRKIRFTTSTSSLETDNIDNPGGWMNRRAEHAKIHSARGRTEKLYHQAQHDPILVRRHQDRTVGLYRDGICRRFIEPDKPIIDSATQRKLISSQFEIAADSDLLWVGQLKGSQWFVKSASPGYPETYSVNEDIEETWKVFNKKKHDLIIWKLFLKAGRKL